MNCKSNEIRHQQISFSPPTSQAYYTEQLIWGKNPREKQNLVRLFLKEFTDGWATRQSEQQRENVLHIVCQYLKWKQIEKETRKKHDGFAHIEYFNSYSVDIAIVPVNHVITSVLEHHRSFLLSLIKRLLHLDVFAY